MNPFVAFRSSSAAAKTHREFVHVQIQHMNIYDLFSDTFKVCKVGPPKWGRTTWMNDKNPIKHR